MHFIFFANGLLCFLGIIVKLFWILYFQWILKGLIQNVIKFGIARKLFSQLCGTISNRHAKSHLVKTWFICKSQRSWRELDLYVSSVSVTFFKAQGLKLQLGTAEDGRDLLYMQDENIHRDLNSASGKFAIFRFRLSSLLLLEIFQW